MTKYNVDYFDIVIARSCQLACPGCCTFSDHRAINGTLDVEQAEQDFKFWSQYVNPQRIHLFGGEPLLHPRLLDIIKLTKKYWPNAKPLWINTNGYLLDKLFDKIDFLFVKHKTALSVTHHTLAEPYSSLVLNNYKKLKELIIVEYTKFNPTGGFYWDDEKTEWDSDGYKKFTVLKNSLGVEYIMMNLTDQHQHGFTVHYKGHGANLEPSFDYTSDAKFENHRQCHIKDYVQLYDGKLWKCPPRAVLNQTLETYNLQKSSSWAPYYTDYKGLDKTATINEMTDWFTAQRLPENSCNMCDFLEEKIRPSKDGRLPKKLFKLKPG